MWLGTEGKGIDVIQVNEAYQIVKKDNYQFDPKDKQSLSYNDVSVIFIASDGNTWVGTFGGGLNKFNPEDKSFTRITKENGLSSNVVLTIEEDMFGNLWVGTGNGLCRLDPENNIQIFDTDDGLQDLEFTKGASFVNQSGELFFGGVNGYNRFHPDDVKENNNIPPVVISDFRLANNSQGMSTDPQKSVLTRDQLTLDYDQNDFSFDFVVLNFSQPDKNQYAYQLTNYDDDWIYAEDGYDITYTNVPPGNYTFKVKGANNDGVWNDIVKFLKPIAYAFTSYADRQFISYKCTFPDDMIPIYFDTDKVEKIVINLLSNALKYTPEFGKVNFTVEEDEQYVILKIADTGVGIPEKHLKYIFNRFYQVEDKHQKGTGIGLALTKELVDLHKGQIDVISKEGEGTIFTVKLLKGRDHLKEEEITGMEIPYQYEHTELSDIELEIPAFNKDSETIKDESESGVDDLPVILVVEDNADMRVFISEYLVTNFKVLEASNGKEALDIAFEHIPDVIVSDIMMPEVSGYDLCEKIKKDDRTSHIPVILLTAKASGESTERGFELGADYYVTKPFNPKLLELRIRNILKTRDKIHHQLMNSNEVNLEPKNLNIGSKDQEFLNKIMACVEDNFANSSFGIDDLCKELGMSRTKLYRKLKGLIGQSANEFIRSFRLKRAAQLLRKQELTISEVTYQVGFNDLQYFRYCFKEQYGVNPSEYAQTAQ
ncbi:unnamed protein product [Symbiodinium microadriaticum]|nr:unnamed protein product [Symbiodinium microadriaticum]